MTDAPYTREELDKAGSSMPTRGYRCPKCGAHVPVFADLPERQATILAWRTDEQPILAAAELRFATGCPESWAQIWVDHGGYPFGPKRKLMCRRSNSRPYNIDEIMSAENHFEALSDLAEVLRSLDKGQILSRAETTFLTSFECWGEVACEGLHGWIFNSPAVLVVREARDAFQAIGACASAEALQKILALAGKRDGEVSDDDLLEGFLAQPGTSERLRSLEAEIEAEDLEKLLYAYIQEHIEEFRRGN